MTRPSLLFAAALLAVAASGCGGGGSGRAAPAATASTTAPTTSTTTSTSTSTSTTPGTPALDVAALVAGYEARRAAYLAHSATGGGHYAQLARLELGLPIDRRSLDELVDFIASRRDTADFGATALVRLLYLHGANPALPQDWRDRAERTLLGWRYWLDQPGRDGMVFWSENHVIMFAAAEYLVGARHPQEVFTNAGLTGAEHARRGRARVERWLDERLRFGFSEWCSPVYYPHDVAPLLNLIDFAPHPEVAARAAMVLDLLLLDLARLTQQGSFGVTAGRAYAQHKLSGRGQSIGDLIEVLFGTRGGFQRVGSTAATQFATSRAYRPPHVLLAIGRDEARPRRVERARAGLRFGEGPAEGIGFTSLDDGVFWWAQGGYMAPEAIGLSRRMIEAWGLWDHPAFSPLRPLRHAPEPLLVGLSQALGPASRGSMLGGANIYAFKTPDAMLSSVVHYAPGRVGFQQHAWQATLDQDALVFTTAPGNLGHDGPTHWTGSASLPQISQWEGVALILYDPPPGVRAVFAEETHAMFPRAGFDEVVERAGWVFGRKGQGYVALYSAQPAYWRAYGPDVGRELVAPGARNAWLCQVGREADDGPFDAFVDAVARARVDVQGLAHGDLTVEFDAPGVGHLRMRWGERATLDGRALHVDDFPRLDGPYARQAWGERRLEVRHAGLSLTHDHRTGVRAGEGL
ncbi:MAG: hypothetical protein KF878_20810 [Planctomycetes bacterium]|nr:hypothetical protein [Planctomycetota bacterium]